MSDDVVLYEQRGAVAVVTLNRPDVRNAQNSAMTYALDRAYYRAAQDDSVAVIVLRANGPHFSAGHDIGSAGRDIDKSYERVSMWWDHVGKEGADNRLAREEEVYLGMCRRWRDIPKPTIAAVHGACIGGALMLVWVCDLIVAADDARFADPVINMGMPGVEYFAHPWEMKPRLAKEFLMLGEPVDARRAYEMGMVNRVVPRDQLDDQTMGIAERLAGKTRFALAVTKKAVNQAEDAMGLRTGMDAAFGLHQLAHAHNAETTGDAILRAQPKEIARQMKGS